MSVRSAAPLISKFRNSEFARKRFKASSMISGSLASTVSIEGYVDIANVSMWDVIDHYTELTWGRRRTTYTGLQRQDSHVTDSIEVGAIVEARMVRLSNGSRIMTSTR